MTASEAIKNVRTIQKGYLKLIEQKVDEGTFLTDDFEGTWKANTPLTEIYKRNAESLEVAITALEENSKLKAMVDKYEYHIDHTDCIWRRVGEKSECPMTCSQYRDGWNDAMNYIFKGGEGYKPYIRYRRGGDGKCVI